jgi:hypothetical protein
VAASGLGFARIWNPATGSFEETMEGTISEATLGLNLYLNAGHQHKIFFDVSRLERSFVEHQGFCPGAQQDDRLRTMIQLKF